MFRVELANIEISKKMKQIEQKTISRKEALLSSTSELDNDRKELMAFVESSNAEVRKMENSKKEKTKEKD